jgi:hypothetical protein
VTRQSPGRANVSDRDSIRNIETKFRALHGGILFAPFTLREGEHGEESNHERGISGERQPRNPDFRRERARRGG